MKLNNWHFLKMLFLSLFVFLYNLNSFTQTNDSLKISGTYNESFINFLQEIGESYHFQSFYQSGWFTNINVKDKFNNVLLSDILRDLLSETQYKFYIIDPNIIVFLKKEDVFKILSKSSFQSTISDNTIQLIGSIEDIGKIKKPELNGTVIDGKSGEAIIGATIIAQNTGFGSTSNVNGKYALKLTPGIFNLIISSIGYEPKNIQIKIMGNGKLDFELFEHSIKIDEVVVSSKKEDNNVRGNQMSLVEMDRKLIKQLPSLFGEKDFIKSMTMMPGVTSIGEFGSGINVRGGSNDQNLFLIEGSPILNSSHVFGLISSINSDAINSVELYKGFIPQNFGERISSVMDIHMRPGDFKKPHISGGIGLIDGRFTIESPILKDKASILIGIRSSYSDWLLKKLPDLDLQKSSAGFYDANIFLTINPNYKNKISVFGYVSSDKFKYSSLIKYSYSNYLASITYDRLYSNRFNSKFIIASSNYTMDKDNNEIIHEHSKINSGIKYNSLKTNFNYTINQSNLINFGTQVIHYSNNSGIQTPTDTSILPYKKLNNEQAIELALFIGDKYDFTENLSIQGGLRISGYAYLGPYQITTYQNGIPRSENSITGIRNYKTGIINKYYNLEPRISSKLMLTKFSSLKISYSQNVQYLNQISYTSISSPDDVWKLSSPYILPVKSRQYAIGYFRNFRNNTIESSIECYYKTLTNLVDYKNGTIISMNSFMEAYLINAKGKNYGLEFFFKKTSGSWDGWISYTYSRSLKNTTSSVSEEQIKDNKVYSSTFDRPHDLTLNILYHYSKRVRLAANYNYYTGRPVTLPEQSFRIDGQNYVQYSDRNKYRLPDYKRLDLSISIDETLYHKMKWKGSWTLSVINVFSNENIFSVIYGQSILSKMLIIDHPLPTLTYNFIF